MVGVKLAASSANRLSSVQPDARGRRGVERSHREASRCPAARGVAADELLSKWRAGASSREIALDLGVDPGWRSVIEHAATDADRDARQATKSTPTARRVPSLRSRSPGPHRGVALLTLPTADDCIPMTRDLRWLRHSAEPASSSRPDAGRDAWPRSGDQGSRGGAGRPPSGDRGDRATRRADGRRRPGLRPRHAHRVRPPGWGMSDAVFGGRVYIADTSAPARAGDPVVRDEWSATSCDSPDRAVPEPARPQGRGDRSPRSLDVADGLPAHGAP